VAQGVGPEFKSQYCKKKKKVLTLTIISCETLGAFHPVSEQFPHPKPDTWEQHGVVVKVTGLGPETLGSNPNFDQYLASGGGEASTTQPRFRFLLNGISSDTCVLVAFCSIKKPL
jgi:hypothetical protein